MKYKKIIARVIPVILGISLFILLWFITKNVFVPIIILGSTAIVGFLIQYSIKHWD